jgi:hypothetical protein
MIVRDLKDLVKNCDALVYSFKKDHKFIFLKGNEPSNITPDPLRKKGRPYIKNGQRLYDVIVYMYEVKSILAGDKKPADVWVVDSLKQAQDQLQKIISSGADQFKSKIIVNRRKG